ncbi:thymocyte selection-associated high mobility group box protein TOX [Lates japonicus]|uniref:Thymocyte selection-associated high mobility group box protein TOX n=1 Tax=Lates japonicus TaxID=270547 RepID=A0AAD3M313_LATJO|nr:thymocyte selection-associated high mobility group box protein TOX [Lates japonicus]
MDVTIYPPPPQPLAASNHTRLGQLSYPDPAFGTNKQQQRCGVVVIKKKKLLYPDTLGSDALQAVPECHRSADFCPNPSSNYV